MDFTKFHYVITVAEQRSFSKAAEKCFISQPALTKAISKIEEELGARLFDRSSTPISLTYAGERYVVGIKNLMAMKYQLDKEIEDIVQLRQGRLTVGIPETRSASWLTAILPHYLENHPGIDVNIVEGTSSRLEQAIIDEEIDISIVTTLPIMQPGIEYEVIGHEQLMIVMPSGHRLFRGRSVKNIEGSLYYIEPRELDGEPFVSMSPGQGLYRAANQMFDFYGIKPKTVVEISNTSTAFYLASGGLGFTIAPVHSALHEKGAESAVFLTISDPPFERTIIASYKKGRELSTAARLFIDMTKRIAADEPFLKTPRVDVIRMDFGR